MIYYLRCQKCGEGSMIPTKDGVSFPGGGGVKIICNVCGYEDGMQTYIYC